MRNHLFQFSICKDALKVKLFIDCFFKMVDHNIGVALVYCKQTRAQALMALKADLVRTILHRFDIVVEESERIDQA